MNIELTEYQLKLLIDCVGFSAGHAGDFYVKIDTIELQLILEQKLIDFKANNIII